MIVLIAPEQDLPEEIAILHGLFEKGLDYYHLRKPFKGYEEHVAYLNQIDSKYHSRIVVHYYHELLNDFDLKGVHLQEQPRIALGEQLTSYVESFQIKGKTVSSSFHELHELEAVEATFDYHLLSPVFASISKKGYEGRGFDVNHLTKKVIGMGGIQVETLHRTLALGFKGVGVLGGVWNAAHPVKSFTAIREEFAKFTEVVR